VDFIIAAATTRPEKLGLPFTRWSLRKLAGYLARNPARTVAVGRERLRQILHARQISPITPCWPVACRTTRPGATPMPDTPTSWPPSVASAPASAANASNAGDDADPKQRDQPRARFMDSALDRSGAGQLGQAGLDSVRRRSG
jgi:hypothetical protein